MLILDNQIFIGNVGDSRAAIVCHKPSTCCRGELVPIFQLDPALLSSAQLCSLDAKVNVSALAGESYTGEPLTDDHKPENREEEARVRQCGGACVQMGPVMRVMQTSFDADGSVSIHLDAELLTIRGRSVG